MPVEKDPRKPTQERSGSGSTQKRSGSTVRQSGGYSKIPKVEDSEHFIEEQSWKVEDAKHLIVKMLNLAAKTEWDHRTDDNLVQYFVPVGEYQLRQLLTSGGDTSECKDLVRQYEQTLYCLTKKSVLLDQGLLEDVKILRGLSDERKPLRAKFLIPFMEKKLKRINTVLQSSFLLDDEHKSLCELSEVYLDQLDYLYSLTACKDD